VPARARQVDELGGPAQVPYEILELLARDDRVAFSGDDDGRCADCAWVHSVQIAGEREGEEALGCPTRGEAFAVVLQVAVDGERGEVLLAPS